MTSENTERNDGELTEAGSAAGDEVGVEGAEGLAGEGEGGVASAMRAVEEELEALKDRYLRLAAEFDNYRKRTERERLEAGDRAQGDLLEKLLDPLDDLKRVAEFDGEVTSVEALLEGIRMVERKLLRALEVAGLERIDPRGNAFDPALHEALMTAPTEDREEDDTVGDVFQVGYLFRGNLLRPARVQVRKYGGG